MYSMHLTKGKLISAFVFALVFNAIVLHWSSTFVGSLPWLILSIGLAVFYIPLALVSRWGISIYPIVFIIMEEFRNHFPFGGFGWTRLAYTQADAPYARIAAIGGSIALSSFVLLIALFLFILYQKRFTLLPIAPVVFLLVPFQLQIPGTTEVLMIQGNVPKFGLDFNSRAKAVFNNHLNLTNDELSKNSNVDFILWPENSVDVDPFIYPDISNALNKIDKPLIIGAVLVKGEKLQNTSILWDETEPKIYIKQHLTPFGEYIPIRSIAKLVSPLVDRVKDFEPGDGANSVFTIKEAKIAPIICFELLDDSILHHAAKNSNLLAVQTNSATFGMSAESAQQLAMTRVRAIEHGRNIISVSTTGYSAVIDRNGKVFQQTSMGTAESIRAKVELLDGQTPRDKLGSWAMFITIGILILIARRAYR
ncbi:MAG: apolipoprotein N-acyltransferase [Actinobacteria bacterium]|nr:apolipoprotein N-acyltransferase [Actinomycetota bacterium]MSZ27729.1 apolipoprotein N-acyltransferase [Actinomycetota bacterium]